MMDRAKKDELPKMQGWISLGKFIGGFRFSCFLVGFIDSICLPLYKVKRKTNDFIRDWQWKLL